MTTTRQAVTNQVPASVIGDPWRDLLGPFLTRTEVRRQLGVGTSAAVDRMMKHKRLLALPTEDGRLLFPAFQFIKEGQMHPTIADVIAILGDVVATPYTIATWLTSPKDLLEAETPIRWLQLERDSARVIAAAELTAARLAR